MQHKSNNNINNLDEILISRKEFARSLGLNDIPVECFEAAINDPLYAHYLVTARNAPEFLRKLLSKPPKKKASEIESNMSLALDVSKALVRWAKSGFSKVNNETYNRRLNACKTCPHYVLAQKNLTIYRIARRLGENNSMICNQCGCIVSKKALLPTEKCPVPSLDYPNYSRWGEPL